MINGKDFIGVAVVYFCHDGQGNFVMAKRGEAARDEKGRWDIGGGSVEWGDAIKETLNREIKEEYCTDVLEVEFLGYRDVHRESDERKSHWVALDFKVLVDRDKVSIGEPHKFTEIGWFRLNSLPAGLHSQLPVFLNKYKERL